MLKIGVSSCFMYPDPDRKVFGPKSLSYLENDMARYLTKSGVMPILIPDVADHLLKEIVKEMDGFVFQGGTDIAPASYGEQPIGQWLGDPRRDAYELRVMELAFRTNKPIFGICRGMQLMNVYFGGTLYQDTKTQRPEVLVHRDAAQYDQISHEVRFVKGKLLDKIYPNIQNPQVNSVHHQSIKDLGKQLEIIAESTRDNVIEAISYTKAPEGWISGVQWHPEFSHTLSEKVIDPMPLYDHFIASVSSLKSEL